MDCGIPFCNNGCPLGNLIPDWNDLVYRDRWQEAIERLHATNNFPEFTGRLCPAPCEAACVLGINQDPVTIKQVEVSIIDRPGRGLGHPGRTRRAHGQARRRRRLRSRRAGRGPAAHPGRPHGGGVRAGRPHRRPAALRHPRVQDGEASPRPAHRPDARRGHRVPHRGRTSAPTSPVEDLRAEFDAIVLAGGATAARDLPIPGRELARHPPGDGVPAAGQPGAGGRPAARPSTSIHAGKHVVIIGGGDTGADCLGTAHRQGAKRRSTSSRSCRGRPTTRAERTRGPRGRSCSAPPRPTRRAASACSR
jgi:glutamate synthase (NADPH/NADH) small chain